MLAGGGDERTEAKRGRKRLVAKAIVAKKGVQISKLARNRQKQKGK